jgi:ADP-ribose pyrophosphatase YjhB (NUDIX family)
VLRLINLLPAPLHIAGLRLAHAVRRRWWKIAGSAVRGCRVLVLDEADRVLLIRHSYGSRHWMLPGGGLDRGEDALAGAAREVAEECAVALECIVTLGQTDDPQSIHETHLIAGWTRDEPRPDRREVLEAVFFSLETLPDPRHPLLGERLERWIREAKAARPPA